MARIREHFCSLIGAQPLLFGLSLADCTPRIPAAFTVHGIHKHMRVGSAHVHTHTRTQRRHGGGHSRSNATDTRRGHRAHTCHTIQRKVRTHARLSRTRACNAIVHVCAYTYLSCVHVCWKIPHTPALCRYSRMTMVEQELAVSRAETRYLCRRWEENRRIKAVFVATAFWTVCPLGPGTFPETCEHGDGCQPIPLVWRT